MNPFSAWSRRALCVPIRWYQKWISPGLGRNCRFTPSCSQYAIEAIQTHGCIKGLLLAAARIARSPAAGATRPGSFLRPDCFPQDTENKWKTNLSVTPAACHLPEQGRWSRKAIKICFL